MSVFNQSKDYNYFDEPMFFGSDMGVARYEAPKHQKFEDLTEKQLAQFWRPEEVNLTLDKAQFLKLSENDQRIFTNNLKYQIIMDTCQGSSPSKAFGAVVSDISLDTWIQTWTFSETIHSRSYTHIIRNLYPDPSKIFDEIVHDDKLMERASSITYAYDMLIELAAQYELAKANDLITQELLRECKKALYLCLHTVNALEAIRFYASFITTFNFFETSGIMEGNSKIMQFIARDENLHHQGTRYILSKLQDGSEGQEWKEICAELRDEATEIFKNVIREEKDWIEYNFRNGCPAGLSKQMLSDFIDYAAVPQMEKLGLDTSGMEYPKRHPIPWLNKFLISANVQAAPQEVEISSYLINQTDMDITPDVIGDFSAKYVPNESVTTSSAVELGAKNV